MQYTNAGSPALQPAEHLWPLTNTALANRHFATSDEREDAQAVRCVTSGRVPTTSARPPSASGGHSG